MVYQVLILESLVVMVWVHVIFSQTFFVCQACAELVDDVRVWVSWLGQVGADVRSVRQKNAKMWKANFAALGQHSRAALQEEPSNRRRRPGSPIASPKCRMAGQQHC
jgi:hypothetical protein